MPIHTQHQGLPGPATWAPHGTPTLHDELRAFASLTAEEQAALKGSSVLEKELEAYDSWTLALPYETC
jgi:hypothetical protein